MKKGIATLTVIMLAFIGAWLWRGQLRDMAIDWSKPAVPSERPRPRVTIERPGPSLTPQATPTPVIGPVNLAVPFSAQAPRGDWSLPYEEACEETSALLVDAYWRGDRPTTDEVDVEIRRLVNWEVAHFGYYEHTTAEQTAQILRQVYGYKKVQVIRNPTIADIYEQVRAGRPVIVPLAGRLLGNPYYRQPGPVYHMMVVKGVAANGDIITNDVGTRHGHNLTYDPDTFLAAMHDAPTGGSGWPAGVVPADYIRTGQRVMIVVWPN